MLNIIYCLFSSGFGPLSPLTSCLHHTVLLCQVVPSCATIVSALLLKGVTSNGEGPMFHSHSLLSGWFRQTGIRYQYEKIQFRLHPYRTDDCGSDHWNTRRDLSSPMTHCPTHRFYRIRPNDNTHLRHPNCRHFLTRADRGPSQQCVVEWRQQ